MKVNTTKTRPAVQVSVFEVGSLGDVSGQPLVFILVRNLVEKNGLNMHETSHVHVHTYNTYKHMYT